MHYIDFDPPLQGVTSSKGSCTLYFSRRGLVGALSHVSCSLLLFSLLFGTSLPRLPRNRVPPSAELPLANCSLPTEVLLQGSALCVCLYVWAWLRAVTSPLPSRSNCKLQTPFFTGSPQPPTVLASLRWVQGLAFLHPHNLPAPTLPAGRDRRPGASGSQSVKLNIC